MGSRGFLLGASGSGESSVTEDQGPTLSRSTSASSLGFLTGDKQKESSLCYQWVLLEWLFCCFSQMEP